MIGTRCLAALAVLALAAASLSGCASSVGDDAAAFAAFAPGRYDLYSCKDLDVRINEVRKRQLELEELTARAEQGPGGAFMGVVAYRSEYVQGRGELMELNRKATERQCAIDNKFSSGRAVF